VYVNAIKKLLYKLIITIMEKVETMKEPENIVYNNMAQVVSCATSMLHEDIEDARIAIVVGHNGNNFVSSSDWRMVTWSGNKRVLSFSMRPQYPNFLECVAGVSYTGQRAKFTVLPDEPSKARGAVVILEEKRYIFSPGQALKIYVEPGCRFIASDCPVECEDKGEGPRIYRILPPEDVQYARLDEKGVLSRD